MTSSSSVEPAASTESPIEAVPVAEAEVEPRFAAHGALSPRAGVTFVETPAVASITERALMYLACGYAVHLAGPAGTGKTTLAFHIAARLGRPVTLLHGNDEFGTSDLVGKDAGYKKSTLVDNYIRSVLKTEERMDVHWTDNRLTTACEHGHALIYDEFNRSRPEANNTLLSILEEGILNLPRTGGDGYLRVHPQFRAIFTSNPEEYAGTHKTQDALLDRMVTIRVDHYDVQTERDVTAAKSGIDPASAALIVDVARTLRTLGSSSNRPTIRACIALARVTQARGAAATPDDPFFRQALWDVFGGAVESAPGKPSLTPELLERIARESAELPGAAANPGANAGAPRIGSPRRRAA